MDSGPPMRGGEPPPPGADSGWPQQPTNPPQQPNYAPQQPTYAPQPGYPPQQPSYPPQQYQQPAYGYAGEPPPGYYAPPRKGGHGLLFGCLFLVIALVLAVVVVLVFALRVPQQLGLIKSPAAAVFANSPDYGTGELAVQELNADGYPTTGLRIYVYENPDGGTIAYAVLDGSEDFSFDTSASTDPVLDFIGRLSELQAFQDSDVRYVAYAFRQSDGKVVNIMSTSTEDAQAFADGSISEDEFVKDLQGWVDPTFLLLSSQSDSSGPGL